MTDFKNWPHLSISQIKTYRRNPSRWVLNKLEGLPTVSGEGAKIGTYVHNIMENLLKGQTDFYLDSSNPYYEIGSKFVRHFVNILGELPTLECEAEKHFSIPLDDNLPTMIGYIDHYHPYFRHAPFVSDLKVSKTRRYFIKTGDELREDLQLMVYAYFALCDARYAKGVWIQQLQYAYELEQEPLRIVRAYVDKDEVMKFMLDLITEVKSTMLVTYKKWLDNKYCGRGHNTKCSSCRFAFGKNSCEFSKICDGEWLTENYVYWYNNTQKKEDRVNMEEVPNKSMGVVALHWLINAYRPSFDSITNTWERREKLTDKIVEVITGSYDKATTAIALPSHMRDKVSPEYEPIVTRLSELGYSIYIRI